MRVALFGHGGMGRVVAAHARHEGHEIGAVFTSRDGGRAAEELGTALRGHDVAIDFSVAPAVPTHVAACVRASVPLVVGTTGWHAEEQAVVALVERGHGSLVYGANFSIGVQLFFRLVARAAELFALVPAYDVFIEEAHHAKKRDAPSGTARELARLLGTPAGRPVPIASTRAGHIPGTHRVGFDSAADQIVLTHVARSRDGFAAGALRAARWLVGQRGAHRFADVLDDILNDQRERGAGG